MSSHASKTHASASPPTPTPLGFRAPSRHRVCWGEKDPWTPAERVLGLSRFPTVERVVPLPDVGHCPHDEAPELVNPLLVDFVRRCADAAAPAAGGAERGEVVPSKGGGRRSGEVKMGLFDAIGKAFSNEEFKEDDQRVSSLGFDSRAMLQPADERVFGSRLCQSGISSSRPKTALRTPPAPTAGSGCPSWPSFLTSTFTSRGLLLLMSSPAVL